MLKYRGMNVYQGKLATKVRAVYKTPTRTRGRERISYVVQRLNDIPGSPAKKLIPCRGSYEVPLSSIESFKLVDLLSFFFFWGGGGSG